VNSLSPTAELFSRVWAELTGDRVERRLAERIYRLSTLIPPRGVSGRGRQIERKDVELLAQWSVDFEAEALEEGRTVEEGRKDIEGRLASDPRERGMFVWEDGGQVVCMAGYGGPTANSLRIAPVYTPPEFRRRGYAAACTAAACEWILGRAGKQFVTLFADLANTTSNGVYQRIGFEAVCDAEMWRFDLTPLTPSPTSERGNIQPSCSLNSVCSPQRARHGGHLHFGA
jgi:predicted GNAT family acetyltransferase